MKIVRALLGALLGVVLVSSVPAQDKATNEPSSQQKEFGTLRVKIVLTESDGSKLISSLPYSVPVSLNSARGGRGFLRIGIRVPLESSPKTGENSTISYADVGTSIDCSLESDKGQDSGIFLLSVSIERSSLYIPSRDADGKLEGREWKQGDLPPGTQPVIHDFRGNFLATVREGQTSEMTVATDPITGHVFKAEVSGTVGK